MNINIDNLKEPFGEMNIIVQCFANDENERNVIYPLIFMPRKERCYTETVDLTNEEERNNYLVHLKDSQERLKILAELLHQQEMEIIEMGCVKTNCYYPDPENLICDNDSQ